LNVLLLRSLTLACGSALTFAAWVNGSLNHTVSPPEVETSSNRDLERRLDAVVNGSGSGPKSRSALEGSASNPIRPRSSATRDEGSARRLTIRTITTLLGLALLGGLLITIRKASI